MGKKENNKMQCTIVQGGFDALAQGCPLGMWADRRDGGGGLGGFR
jgi:hypothetical protein